MEFIVYYFKKYRKYKNGRKRKKPIHAVSLSFSQDDGEGLLLAGKQVFLFLDAVLEKAMYDAETIRYSFDLDRCFEISFCWHEAKTTANDVLTRISTESGYPAVWQVAGAYNQSLRTRDNIFIWSDEQKLPMTGF